MLLFALDVAAAFPCECFSQYRVRKYNFPPNHDPINSQFITDPGVEQCGSLTLTLGSFEDEGDAAKATTFTATSGPREIQAKMLFGDTEIKATALDVR